MQKIAFNKLFAVTVLALAITGCASDGGAAEDAAVLNDGQAQEVAQTPAVDTVKTQEAQAANPMLSQTTIYFGFDRADISPEFKDVLNAHAKFLQANPQSSIVFEGHCDERGTIEYNLALGERRASAVKSYLVVRGVSLSQLKSVSFGEERPASLGSSELDWSKNRRAEIKYSPVIANN
jgi:peptidoglycan-associated lipoprotein